MTSSSPGSITRSSCRPLTMARRAEAVLAYTVSATRSYAEALARLRQILERVKKSDSRSV